jgi:hypothetical protein
MLFLERISISITETEKRSKVAINTAKIRAVARLQTDRSMWSPFSNAANLRSCVPFPFILRSSVLCQRSRVEVGFRRPGPICLTVPGLVDVIRARHIWMSDRRAGTPQETRNATLERKSRALAAELCGVCYC